MYGGVLDFISGIDNTNLVEGFRKFALLASFLEADSEAGVLSDVLLNNLVN